MEWAHHIQQQSGGSRSFHLRTVPDVDPDSFDQALEQGAGPHLFQSYAWGELKRSSGWQVHRLILTDDGAATGGVTFLERPFPLLPVSLLYCPKGPALDLQNEAVRSLFFEAARTLADETSAVCVTFDPPIQDGTHRGKTVDRILRRLDCRTAYRDLPYGGLQARIEWHLSLKQKASEQRKQLQDGHRFWIRRAREDGLTVTERTRDGVPILYHLIKRDPLGGHKPWRHPSYFRSAIDQLTRLGKHTRIFTVEQHGQPAAAVLVTGFGDTLWLLYWGTGGSWQATGALHLLVWEILRWGSKRGYHYARLGSAPLDSTALGSRLERLRQGFGAQPRAFLGEYDLIIRPLFYRFWQWGFHGLRCWSQAKETLPLSLPSG